MAGIFSVAISNRWLFLIGDVSIPFLFSDVSKEGGGVWDLYVGILYDCFEYVLGRVGDRWGVIQIRGMKRPARI